MLMSLCVSNKDMYGKNYNEIKFKIIEFLLNNYSDLDLNIKNNYGNTAFIYLCDSDNGFDDETRFNIIKMFLYYKNGSYNMFYRNPNTSIVYNNSLNVNEIDQIGNSPLISICCSKFIKDDIIRYNIMKELLNHGADVNIVGENKETVLMLACMNENIKDDYMRYRIVKLLVKDRVVDVNIVNEMGYNALMFACGTEHIKNDILRYKIVKLLISCSNIDTRIMTANGKTISEIILNTENINNEEIRKNILSLITMTWFQT
jgi:ankyrin repeat protein